MRITARFADDVETPNGLRRLRVVTWETRVSHGIALQAAENAYDIDDLVKAVEHGCLGEYPLAKSGEGLDARDIAIALLRRLGHLLPPEVTATLEAMKSADYWDCGCIKRGARHRSGG